MFQTTNQISSADCTVLGVWDSDQTTGTRILDRASLGLMNIADIASFLVQKLVYLNVLLNW